MAKLAVKYQAEHKKVRGIRGLASKLYCVDCNEKANHWSHVHNTDPTDVMNYEPRCYSCHRKYDNPSLGERNGNCKLSEAEVLEIRSLFQNGSSYDYLSIVYGVTKSNIGQIIRRDRWKHI